MPILVAVRDLLFRSRIQAAAERLAAPVRFVPRDVPLGEAARALGDGVILADLSEPGVLEQVREVKRSPGFRVIGFLGHVEVDLAQAATDAGVDEVLSRGQLVQRLDAILSAART